MAFPNPTQISSKTPHLPSGVGEGSGWNTFASAGNAGGTVPTQPNEKPPNIMQTKPANQARERVARASLRQSAFTTNQAPRIAGGLAAALLWVGTFPVAATTVTIEPAIITLD